MAANRIQILSPVTKPKAEDRPLAPRLRSLQGKVVGLLDNGKPNFDVFLARAEELLSQRYAFAQVVRASKPTVKLGAPLEVITELSEKCDLVITGVGD